ncbi:MAG TPA: cytochrome c [Candidatus Cybelea sp.]|nr:cytochrome c [Candidatus Cybelea sp.]
MCKNLLLMSAVCLAASLALGQDTAKPIQSPPPSDSKIPPEAVKEPNPVKATPDSIERGKKLYGYDCAMCHGSDGGGKGDLAADMKLELADLRNMKTLKDRTDGEIFYIIKNGEGQMPGERDRAKSNQMWDVVNYVRSLPKKEAAPKAGDQPPQLPPSR